MRVLALCLTLSVCVACGTTAEAQPVRTTPPPPCDRACWERIVARQHAERAWWAEVVRQQKARRDYARLLAFAAAVDKAKRAEAARPRGHCYIEGIRVCDGPGLLPFHVVWRESRMNPRARNRSSSAGGFAQMLIGTMRSVCPREAARYGNAAYAPVAVQVECVRRLIARHGLRPWAL